MECVVLEAGVFWCYQTHVVRCAVRRGRACTSHPMDFAGNPTRRLHTEMGILAFRGDIKTRQVDHCNV